MPQHPTPEIQNEECISHIHKRMFKGLEMVAKDVNGEVKFNQARVGMMGGATTPKKGRGKKADSTSHEATAILTTTMGGKGHMTSDRMKK